MTFGIENAIALMIATAILGLSPGPAVFATVARSINLPFKRTAFFIAGIVFGDFVFAMMAMGGLAVLVSQHQTLFQILRCVGGGYLLYLGMMALVSKATVKDIQSVAPESRLKLMTSGFLLTAGNPKDLLFFVSFLPAFIDLKTAGAEQMAMAAAVIVVTFVATLSFYAALISVVGKWLRNPKTLFWLDRMAGVILIAVGLIVLFAH
ncbi:MAG: hypothetical protein A3B66_06175 [Alphaproteobacteria bacterium RIFCSPHIGHO2_02_FULL_46_13]|nr:MAG: hypothetical protein A3B66_06175 [Alphaproteobacteria bacterium RIFCSPHIGHO2_02_FULL_46_13]